MVVETWTKDIIEKSDNNDFHLALHYKFYEKMYIQFESTTKMIDGIKREFIVHFIRCFQHSQMKKGHLMALRMWDAKIAGLLYIY